MLEPITPAERLFAGLGSPAAGRSRYQNAMEDRDVAIADAVSGSQNRLDGIDPERCPWDMRGMKTKTRQPDHRPHPSWPAVCKRAADQDRTGIISLEG